MIKKIAVIGTGVIGTGWIVRCLAHNKKVIAYDKDLRLEKKLISEIKRAWPFIKKLFNKKKINLKNFKYVNSIEEAVKEARAKLFVRGMLENWYISTFLDPEESQIVEDNFHAFAYAYANNTDVIEGVPDGIIEKLLNHLTFTGDFNDVDQFVEEMVKFKNSGLDEFAIRLYKNPELSMEVIAEQVVPHL